MEHSHNDPGSKGNKSSGANKAAPVVLAAAAALAAVTNESRLDEETDDEGNDDNGSLGNSNSLKKRGTPNFKDNEFIRLALILAENRNQINIFTKYKNVSIGESVKRVCELFNDPKTHVDLEAVLTPADMALFSSQFESFESTFVTKRSEKTIFNVRGRIIGVLSDHLRPGADVIEGSSALKQLIPVKSQIYVLACIIVFRYFHLSIPLTSRQSKNIMDGNDQIYSDQHDGNHVTHIAATTSSSSGGNDNDDDDNYIGSKTVMGNRKITRMRGDGENNSSGFMTIKDMQSNSKRLNDEFSTKMEEMEKKITILNESINQKSKQKERERSDALLRLYNECIVHGTDEIKKLADEVMKKFMDE